MDCLYKVTSVNGWNQSLKYGSVYAVANIKDGELKGDSKGHYSGTGKVTWVLTGSVNGCSYAGKLADSSIKMTGEMNNYSELVITLNYVPTAFKETIKCQEGTGGSTGKISFSAIKISVPAQGGAALGKPVLAGPAGAVPGYSQIYVVREKRSGQ